MSEKILDERAIAEIEAQNRIFMNPNIDALCATVRQLLAEDESLTRERDALRLAAEQMRSACVKKVRELASDYKSLSLSEWFTKYGDERWENVVIPALESLTLQEQKS